MINRPLHTPLVQHFLTHSHTHCQLRSKRFFAPTHTLAPIHFKACIWIYYVNSIEMFICRFLPQLLSQNWVTMSTKFVRLLFGQWPYRAIARAIHTILYMPCVRCVKRSPNKNRINSAAAAAAAAATWLYHFHCDLVNAVACRCIYHVMQVNLFGVCMCAARSPFCCWCCFCL